MSLDSVIIPHLHGTGRIRDQAEIRPVRGSQIRNRQISAQFQNGVSLSPTSFRINTFDIFFQLSRWHTYKSVADESKFSMTSLEIHQIVMNAWVLKGVQKKSGDPLETFRNLPFAVNSQTPLPLGV